MLNNFSMRAKLFLIVGFLSTIAVVVAITGVIFLSGMNETTHHIVERSSEKLKLASEMETKLITISRAEKNMILSTEEKEMKEFITIAEKAKVKLEENANALEKLVDEDGKIQFKRFKAKFQKWYDLHKQVQKLTLQNSNTKAAKLSSQEGKATFELFVQSLKDAIEITGNSGLKDVLAMALQMHNDEKSLILSRDPKEMSAYSKQMERMAEKIGSKLNRLKTSTSDKQSRAIEKPLTTFLAYEQINEQIQKLSQEKGK